MKGQPRLTTALLLVVMGIVIPLTLWSAPIVPADLLPPWRVLLAVGAGVLILGAYDVRRVWYGYHQAYIEHIASADVVAVLEAEGRKIDKARSLSPELAELILSNGGFTLISMLGDDGLVNFQIRTHNGDLTAEFMADFIAYSSETYCIAQAPHYTTERDRKMHSILVNTLIEIKWAVPHGSQYPARFVGGGYQKLLGVMRRIDPDYNVQTWKPE